MTDLKAAAEAAKAAGHITMSVPPNAAGRFYALATPDAVLALYAERDEARERAERFEKLDCEAATHVESVIAMRTGFTGDPPYVGWKGLGLALTEALDKRDAAEAALAAERAEVERLLSAMDREEAYLHRMIDASEENGGIMHGDLEGAFHRIRDKDSDDAERAEALTKEPPHAG